MLLFQNSVDLIYDELLQVDVITGADNVIQVGAEGVRVNDERLQQQQCLLKWLDHLWW